MNKNNENKLVPKLRFPEFMDFGAWEIDEVGNVFDVTRGYVLAMNLVTEEQSENNPFPVYSSQTKNKGLAGYYKDYLYEDAITWTTDGANAGDVNFRKGKFYCTNVCGVLINKKGYSNHCVAALINSVSRKHVSYVGNPKLMNGVMSKIRIPFPKIPEQQKIAACLSSLDEVITAESQKLDVLKDHKKSLLQNLLPQAGETVPKFRFKEFEDSGEWVEKKLGDVADFINGRAYKQHELLSEGKYRVLRVGNFFTNNEWYYSDLELDEDKYCDNGDLLYAWSASFGPRIWNGEKVIYHYHIWKVKSKSGINKKFLFNLLDCETERMKSQMANGFALLHITKGTIENWKSHIPVSEKEQEKIADTLSSIDDLIIAQSQKLGALQLHKKGLLQGLFPNVNEVTA